MEIGHEFTLDYKNYLHLPLTHIQYPGQLHNLQHIRHAVMYSPCAHALHLS